MKKIVAMFVAGLLLLAPPAWSRLDAVQVAGVGDADIHLGNLGNQA